MARRERILPSEISEQQLAVMREWDWYKRLAQIIKYLCKQWAKFCLTLRYDGNRMENKQKQKQNTTNKHKINEDLRLEDTSGDI